MQVPRWEGIWIELQCCMVKGRIDYFCLGILGLVQVTLRGDAYMESRNLIRVLLYLG